MRDHAINSARSLLTEYGISVPPVSIEKIARQLGAKLRYSPLDDELSGMIFVKDSVPIIVVNALHHPNRQRFTIAHEVGHLRLHKDQITKEVHVDKGFLMLHRDATAASGVDKIEIQANAFAAEILMPEDFLKEFLEGKSFDMDDDTFIANLARKFKVSTQAIRFRLGNILN